MPRIAVKLNVPEGEFCINNTAGCLLRENGDYCQLFSQRLSKIQKNNMPRPKSLKCPACLAACKESEGRE